jgi:hypothetical protein
MPERFENEPAIAGFFGARSVAVGTTGGTQTRPRWVLAALNHTYKSPYNDDL